MKELIAMTDEARAAVRYNGPTDKQLILALLDNHIDTLPSERHIRWMAAEILRQRKWKIRAGYIGGKSTLLHNGVLVAPGVKMKGFPKMADAALAREALRR